MSNRINEYGTVSLTVAASDILTIYSKDTVKVYQKTLYPNFPDTLTLLATATAGTEYASSAFSSAAEIMIEASGAEAFYQVGTAAVVTERRALRGQGAPGVLNATGALTAAMILSGIVTSTTAAAVAGTVPTGTVMDAAFDIAIGESVDWSVIATGANAFTVTAATAHTLVGSGVVATVTSGAFRTRKTAANTFVTYRIG
jgi:hypothetical protein